MHKIQNIQGLRGIAVLLVLLVHIGLVEKKYSLHPILPDFVQFGMSGVDIFFLISGFIMMRLSMNQVKDVRHAIRFLHSRILRIYPIYWFYSILVLIAFFVQPDWVNSSTEVEINLLKSFLLIPDSGLPLLQVGWTLLHEMYFYIGFFFLLLFVRNNRTLFQASMLWMIVVISINGVFDFSDPIMKVVVNPLTLEFLAGVIVAYISTDMELKLSVLKLKWIFAFALLMLLVSYIVFEAYIETRFRIVMFGVPSIVLLFIVIKLEEKGYTFPSWLNVIGDRSYTIYLSHLLVINVLGHVWQYFSFENIVTSFLFIIILIVATLAYGKYAYEWIELPMLRRCKELFSMRNKRRQ